MSPIATQLEEKFGRSFELKNLYRMMQFAKLFPKREIVVTLSRQLSWSHFVILLPIKEEEQRNFYAQMIASERWTVRNTRYQIERKAFERSEIANTKASSEFENIQRCSLLIATIWVSSQRPVGVVWHQRWYYGC